MCCKIAATELPGPEFQNFEECSFDNPGAFPPFESTSVPAVRDETKLRKRVVADCCNTVER